MDKAIITLSPKTNSMPILTLGGVFLQYRVEKTKTRWLDWNVHDNQDIRTIRSVCVKKYHALPGHYRRTFSRVMVIYLYSYWLLRHPSMENESADYKKKKLESSKFHIQYNPSLDWTKTEIELSKFIPAVPFRLKRSHRLSMSHLRNTASWILLLSN